MIFVEKAYAEQVRRASTDCTVRVFLDQNMHSNWMILLGISALYCTKFLLNLCYSPFVVYLYARAEGGPPAAVRSEAADLRAGGPGLCVSRAAALANVRPLVLIFVRVQLEESPAACTGGVHVRRGGRRRRGWRRRGGLPSRRVRARDAHLCAL